MRLLCWKVADGERTGLRTKNGQDNNQEGVEEKKLVNTTKEKPSAK